MDQTNRTQIPRTLIFMLTYNNEDTLQVALENLLNQTYQEFDLFIFDDASQDQTYSILKDFSKNNPKIKLTRNKENLGVLENLKRSLMEINPVLKSYDYFLWACADDEWGKEYLSQCVAALESNKTYAASQSYVQVNYLKTEKQFVQKYVSLSDQSPYTEIKQIFQHQDADGEPLHYNQCIHSVIRTKYVSKIFPLLKDRFVDYLICELFIVGLLVVFGGIVIVPQTLATKNIESSFETKYPEDSYTKKQQSSLRKFLSSIRIISCITYKVKKRKLLRQVILDTFIFYSVWPRYIKGKIFLYEKFIKRVRALV